MAEGKGSRPAFTREERIYFGLRSGESTGHFGRHVRDGVLAATESFTRERPEEASGRRDDPTATEPWSRGRARLERERERERGEVQGRHQRHAGGRDVVSGGSPVSDQHRRAPLGRLHSGVMDSMMAASSSIAAFRRAGIELRISASWPTLARDRRRGTAPVGPERRPLEGHDQLGTYLRSARPLGVGDLRGDDGRPRRPLRRATPLPCQRRLRTSTEGLTGDSWQHRRSSATPGWSPDPECQLTLMNARVPSLASRGPDRWVLAGDRLFVDFDLSIENAPLGTRRRIGSVVVEVTHPPHLGCAKFVSRFGEEAMRFVNSLVASRLRLRGPARPGDPIDKGVGADDEEAG